jgi:hypothetical protein
MGLCSVLPALLGASAGIARGGFRAAMPANMRCKALQTFTLLHLKGWGARQMSSLRAVSPAPRTQPDVRFTLTDSFPFLHQKVIFDTIIGFQLSCSLVVHVNERDIEVWIGCMSAFCSNHLSTRILLG